MEDMGRASFAPAARARWRADAARFAAAARRILYMSAGAAPSAAARMARDSWPGPRDAMVIAACVLGPLVLAGWFDGPVLAVDAGSIAARAAAGLAARRLLARLGATADGATIAAAAYGAVALHAHAPAGAALALLLLAVARAREVGAKALLGAACAVALAFTADDARAAAVALTLSGAWALWRVTSVPGGWDARAARRLLGGAALGAVAAAAGAALAPQAPDWLIAPAAVGFDPFDAAAIAVAAALVAVLGVATAAPRRALDWLLLPWTMLCAGRALGMPGAAFVLDIPATMPDPAFLDRAVPSLVLAVLIAATTPAARGRRARWIVLAAALIALARAATIGPVPRPALVADGDVPHARTAPLAAGETITGIIPGAAIRDGDVRRIGVEIATYLGAADGALAVSLCADTRCETGTVKLAGAADNAVLFATLPRALPTRQGQPLRWRVTHVGGKSAVAVWLAPSPGGRSIEGPGGPVAEMSAHVVLEYFSGHRAFWAGGP